VLTSLTARLVLKHLTMSVVVFAFLNASSADLFSQQEPNAPVQIYDVPVSGITFIQSIKSNQTHIGNFLTDFMGIDSYSKFWAPYPEEVSRTKPIVYYGNQAIDLPFDSPDLISNLAMSKPDFQPDKPFRIGEKILMDSPVFGSSKSCYGMVLGNRLIAVSKGNQNNSVLDQVTFDRFKGAKRLNDSLDPRMLEILGRAGVGVVTRPDDKDTLILDWLLRPRAGQTHTAKEKELVKKLNLAGENASFAAGGITYVKRQLNTEFHVKFSNKDSFKGIFDFEKAAESKFEPTVGLSKKELLLSLSVHNGIFASAEVPRIVQKWMLRETEQWLAIGQDSAMFELTSGLLADFWRDVSGARVAAYHPRPDVFSVVSIVDAKEPDNFFSEIEKLVAIVEPDQANGLSELAAEEVDRLISDLGSKKYSVRQRAQRRLEIAGRRAVPALKKAISETESAEVRARATQIVTRQQERSTNPQQKVSNLNFWANLDLELVIEKGFDELFGFPSRRVKVQLPKGLTDQEKQDATKTLEQLFGEDWARVEVVRVDGQFVIMFGYDEALLKETLENLKGRKDPIGELAAADDHWLQEGSLQLHVSFQRLKKLFVNEKLRNSWGELGVDHPETDVLTSLSLLFSPDYWQLNFNFPVEEIKPCLKCENLFRKP